MGRAGVSVAIGAMGALGAGCSLLTPLDGYVGGAGPDASVAAGDGSAPADASTNATPTEASAGDGGDAGDGGPSLLFDDEFDGTALSNLWTPSGGTWGEAAGVATQTTATGNPYTAVSSLASLTDYQVVSKVRQVSGDPAGAVEVAFRVSGGKLYFCSWFANQKTLTISKIGTAGYAALNSVVLTPPASLTPTSPVTLESTVKGNVITCTIPELLPAATVTATDGEIASGAPGLKSYLMSGEWDYIRVYDVK